MKLLKVGFVLVFLGLLLLRCNNAQQQKKNKIPCSVQLGQAVIDNNKEAWMIDFQSRHRWGYVQGLVSLALQRVSEQYNMKKFDDYVKNTYVDLLIDSIGNIKGYKKKDFKLDDVNSGKLLFALYKETGDKRYRKAMNILMDQLKDQPRISEGGFWHKKIYTNQMWLDGLYMGLPFYAQFTAEYGDSADFDDITSQLLLVQKHMKDKETGLYYHGWDASKSVYWADPQTGLSKNFWGRGIGWFYMAIVDVLDFLPENHKDRPALITMFQDLTDAILKYQQKDSGVWYQVLNYPNREGNYLESTCSCMFAYGLFKGISNGFLSKKYLKAVQKAYKGIFKTFVKKDDKGNPEITDCCAGAGLGPADNPVRDGSYDYYIHEKIRSNDGKALGPLIMTCLLVESMDVESH